MAAWPGTLPATFLRSGFSEAAEDGVIRTSVDVGPNKRRQRYTATPTFFRGRMWMTSTQIAALETFYAANAAAAFTFTHPRTGATVNVSFAARPTYGEENGTKTLVSLELEQEP